MIRSKVPNTSFIGSGYYNLRYSFYWFCASLFFILEVSIVNGFFIKRLTYRLLPDLLIYSLEYAALSVSIANALFCFFSYLVFIYQTFINQLLAEKKRLEQRSGRKQSEIQKLDKSERADCIQSLYAFTVNFFRLSRQPLVLQKDLSLTLSSSLTGSLRNTSLSSLIGYRDSPLNNSVASVHTSSQLKELLEKETCDSVIDPTDCTVFFNKDFGGKYNYYPGTVRSLPHSDTAYTAIKSFISESENVEEQHKRQQHAVEKRVYHRAFTGAEPKPKVFIETRVKEMLKLYDLDETNLKVYELKLRIWLYNTIVRPLSDKIREMNAELADKFGNLHITVGETALEILQSAILHKPDLCDTLLPFILPYIRIHQNQKYVVSRVHILAQNIALEDFNWNSGGDIVQEEKEGFFRELPWNEHLKLPSDVELLWHLFSTYMDFHLSPNSSSVSMLANDLSSKPFSNVFFVRCSSSTSSSSSNLPVSPQNPVISSSSPLNSSIGGGGAESIGEFPAAYRMRRQKQLNLSSFGEEARIDEQNGEFFIRMSGTTPPVFELVIDRGFTVLIPAKATAQNFWLVLILFLAHVKKFANNRIGGNVHLTAYLDIFD